MSQVGVLFLCVVLFGRGLCDEVERERERERDRERERETERERDIERERDRGGSLDTVEAEFPNRLLYEVQVFVSVAVNLLQF